jgi:hypothetical protein
MPRRHSATLAVELPNLFMAKRLTITTCGVLRRRVGRPRTSRVASGVMQANDKM